MSYHDDTANTTHFVTVIRVVTVTNDLIQIVHVETYELGILYQEFV